MPQRWTSVDAGWRWACHVGDAWCTQAGGWPAIGLAQAARRNGLLAWARRHSPFYRRLYAGLPPAPPWQSLPAVGKRELMARFDEWVTDPAVTLEGVRAFVASPDRVGTPFLGRYAVFSTSGTTGVPGLFVQDPQSLAVYDALAVTRLGALAPAGDARQLFAGHRVALIAATGGHFAGVASWERLREIHGGFRQRSCVIPVTLPLAQVVRRLESFRPTVVASYATVLRALAAEREAGRLDLEPVVLWYGGEWLSPAARVEIQSAFGCRVAGDYGASEFMNIAFECELGELHLNADWVVLEAVDERHRPVPPGVPSATVLLTHLANRVQPLIRYELGDSVTFTGAPCLCGRPFPVIRVEGRRDDILRLRDAGGAERVVVPLAIATVVEEATGLHRFQVVQRGEARLSVRVDCAAGEWAAASRRVRAALVPWLASQGLGNVVLEVRRAPVLSDPVSGKFRQVWRECRGGRSGRGD